MKYKYEKRVLELQNGKKILLFDLPKEIELVEVLLSSDIQGHDIGIRDAIDDVVRGKEKFKEIVGNVCMLQIGKYKTIVTDALADDSVGNACVIETAELRKLIDIWLDEVKHFYN